MLLIVSLLLFAAVSAMAYAVLSALAADRSQATLRLRDLRQIRDGSGLLSAGRRRSSLRRMVVAVGGSLPGRDGGDTLRTALSQAGFRRGDSVALFVGAKLLLAAALPMGWLGLAWLLARPGETTVLQAAGLAVLGFYLPTLWLSWRTNSRRNEIRLALPDALDLLLICVEAGLGIGAAIQRVGTEIALTCPALSDELMLVNQEMLTGVPRAEALQHLATRTGVDDVRNLVSMLLHADRLGTSIGQSLRAHAQTMRTRRRQRAEQMARKASIKMLFPLVFLVLPALMVVILGPAAIQVLKAIAPSG